MPKVSVVIPTYNRPDSLREALQSVFDQAYKNFEVIVVDDGMEVRAKNVIDEFNDNRLRYIQHEVSKDGGAARNTGIENSKGDFIAFLDDDDTWYKEKLKVQMEAFENAPDDVGFSFTAVENVFDDHTEITRVPDGVDNYFKLLLKHFSGFLNVTMIIKKNVFDDVGVFDEEFPSHQETDLLIRIMKKYKGLAISRPLTHVNMRRGHSLKVTPKRIKGREMILKKYHNEFASDSNLMAHHYFRLALLYRDDKQYDNAKDNFKKAFQTEFRLMYTMHYLSMLFCALPYKIVKK